MDINGKYVLVAGCGVSGVVVHNDHFPQLLVEGLVGERLERHGQRVCSIIGCYNQR